MANALDYYRLKTPQWTPSIGHGARPEGLVIVRGGRRYCIPWGTEVRASASCDPGGGVANLDHAPPLVRCRVIDRFADQFEHLPAS